MRSGARTFAGSILFMMAATGALLQAAEYYVSPGGSDTNSGTSASPWKTVQKAAGTLIAGDTVYLMEGTYREQVVPLNSGTPGRYITYTAAPGQKATIDGTGLKLAGWGLFQISGKQYIKVSGLRFTNSPSYGIGEEGSSYIVFERNYVYNTVNSGIIAAEFAGPERPYHHRPKRGRACLQ